MLLEIFIGLNVLAFVLMILSFIPLGEKKKVSKANDVEEFKSETQSYVVLFPWLAMGLLFLLATAAMDITIVNCDLTSGDAWTCNEYQYSEFALPWVYLGLGVIMLAYAIVSTFLWSAGTILTEVNRLPGSNNRDG